MSNDNNLNVREKRQLPIIFTGSSIPSIKALRKTQTRRIVKGQPAYHHTHSSVDYMPDEDKFYWWWGSYTQTIYHDAKCPYGKKGDQLWVRESFCYAWNEDDSLADKNGKAVFDKKDAHRYFAADPNPGLEAKWIPSIHMPKWAARLWLENIADARVEHLNDISEADALAEGVVKLPATGRFAPFEGAQYFGLTFNTAKDAFRHLWETLHGPGSWAANPFVWVITFKLTEGDVE